jgi:hypothetical protein
MQSCLYRDFACDKTCNVNISTKCVYVVLLWVVTPCGYQRVRGTVATVFRVLEAVCNAYLFVYVRALWNHRVFFVVL